MQNHLDRIEHELIELVKSCSDGQVVVSSKNVDQRLSELDMDSFALMAYFVAVQERFKVDLSKRPVAQVDTVASLARLLTSELATEKS